MMELFLQKCQKVVNYFRKKTPLFSLMSNYYRCFNYMYFLFLGNTRRLQNTILIAVLSSVSHVRVQ